MPLRLASLSLRPTGTLGRSSSSLPRTWVVIPSVWRPLGGRTRQIGRQIGRLGRRPCPLCLIWTGWDTIDREFTIPNLFYYSSFSYCCPPIWWLVILGGCPWKRVGRQLEQLRKQVWMGTSVDNFGHKPHTVHKWVESLSADVREQREFGHGCEVRARTTERLLKVLHW